MDVAVTFGNASQQADYWLRLADWYHYPGVQA